MSRRSLSLGLLLLVLPACFGFGRSDESIARDSMCIALDRLLNRLSDTQADIESADFDALGDAIDDFESSVQEYDRLAGAPGLVDAMEALPLELATGGGESLEVFLHTCEPYYDRQLEG